MLSLLIWKIVVNQANDFNRLTVIGGIYCFYLQTIAIQLYSLPYECRKLVVFGTLLNVWTTLSAAY